MTTKFLYSSGVVVIAAMVAFFFVNSLARAFHVRLTPDASFFLACCMLTGSVVSITAANIIISICREKDPPAVN